MQPSKCKAKFDGVGRAVNETTSTKNTEDSDHLISRDEIIIAFSECMGEPIDEIARVGGDEQQMTALVNTKVAALLGSGGSGAMENVSDIIRKKRGLKNDVDLKPDLFQALLLHKGAGGKVIKAMKKKERVHLDTSNAAIEAVAAVEVGTYTIVSMSKREYWEKYDERRLGSLEDQDQPDDPSGAFTIEYWNRVGRTRTSFVFIPWAEATTANYVLMMHGLGEILPESPMAQHFANIKDCDIKSGKDILIPYVLAYKYPKVFWSVVLYTTYSPETNSVTPGTVEFYTLLECMFEGKLDFRYLMSIKRSRKLSAAAKQNLANEESKKKARRVRKEG